MEHFAKTYNTCQLQLMTFHSLCEYLKRNLIKAAAILLRELFRCNTQCKHLAGASLFKMVHFTKL